MEMVAEGVLQVSANLGCCNIHPTFTAVVEGKNAKEVRDFSESHFYLQFYITFLNLFVIPGR